MGRLGIRFERPEKKPSASRGYRLEAGGRENARRSGRVQRMLQASLAEARKTSGGALAEELAVFTPLWRQVGTQQSLLRRLSAWELVSQPDCRIPIALVRTRVPWSSYGHVAQRVRW